MMPAQPYGYNQPRPANQPAQRNQQQPKPAVVRGQIPDVPPAPIAMPAPEAFGIRLNKADEAPLDWNTLRQQLDRLGASSFQLDKHGDGYRFASRLPSGLIEGVGTTEAEAVRLALAKAAK